MWETVTTCRKNSKLLKIACRVWVHNPGTVNAVIEADGLTDQEVREKIVRKVEILIDELQYFRETLVYPTWPYQCSLEGAGAAEITQGDTRMDFLLVKNLTAIFTEIVKELMNEKTQEEIADIFDIAEDMVEEATMIGSLVASITERLVFDKLDPLVNEDLRSRGIIVHPSSNGKFGELADVAYQYFLENEDDPDTLFALVDDVLG